MTSQRDGELVGLRKGAISAADGVAAYEPFRVLEQRVQLDLNFREKQIQGVTNIKIFKLSNDLEYISLDARQLDIDKDGITVNNQKVRVEYKDPYDLMDTPAGYTWTARQHHLRTKRMEPLQHATRPELPMSGREQNGCQPVSGSLRIWLRPEKNNKIVLKPQTPGVSSSLNPPVFNEYDVTIPFRINRVRDGLHFAGVEDGDMRYPHAYTRHSIERGFTSCLFPCVDDRTRVPEWRISLKFPRTVGDALKQPLASQANPSAAPVHQVSRKDQGRREAQLAEEDKLLDMTAVCSGTLVGEPLDAEDATKKVMEFQARDCGAQHIGFAIGPFEDVDLYTAFRSEEDEAKLAGNAVKVHGYCLPGRREEVCHTCQPLAHATDFFTLNFSKYPYDEGSFKICFVDDMVEDAVPLQSFALCSSRLLYPEGIIDPEVDITRKLVHTLASQYFGIFINPNEITDTWIVVGLAYYMTDLYLRKLCGNNYYRFQVRTAAERLTEVDYGRPSLHELGRVLALGEFEMDFLALKAPLIIFILDRRLLKSSNSSGVTRVISQRLRDAMQAPDLSAANFVISSEQFRRQCEKRGRLRLEDFWDQWVMSSGCPRFHVTQRFNKKRLEVEVLVAQNQVKWSQEPHELQKEEFWRDIIEERHGVEASEVPLTFTGPMTFRVHEADGTPYEHCLEIKLDAAATKGSKLSMPYNTKYKRIKRVRHKKKDKSPAKARDPDRMEEDAQAEEEEEQKAHTLTTFGDVLVGEDEMAVWKLVDWDDDQQASMDQESYEWIRVDCDFEWIYSLETNFKVYMTVAQLQQDRDIAGQVEAMLALTRNQPSNIQTTMLLRTLFDNRYYYGIRAMAADALTGHAEPANNFRGMHHLIRTFETFFCFPGTSTPRPNDFSNKKEYYIQAAIPLALARIRGGRAFCPQAARQLILDQLRFNNNDENPFSDQFYVAKLLQALAASLIRAPTDNPLQSEMTPELESFLEEALATIERYEKMDEWACSHNNIITITALDCKMKLMKCGVIKIDPLAFIQYLNPQTDDLIQVKAYESLIELGFLLRGSVMKLLLAEIGTHRSPFVRAQLFNALTRGLAAIAFGEKEPNKEPEPGQEARRAGQDADGDIMLDDDNDGGLIIEQSDDVIRKKQEDIARQIDITTAVKHLKQTLQDNGDLQRELWKTVDSASVGLAEKRNLLELCALLFPEDYEMMVTMKYPTRWTVQRGASRPGRVSYTSNPSRRNEPNANNRPVTRSAIQAIVQDAAPEKARRACASTGTGAVSAQRRIFNRCRSPHCLCCSGSRSTAAGHAVRERETRETEEKSHQAVTCWDNLQNVRTITCSSGDAHPENGFSCPRTSAGCHPGSSSTSCLGCANSSDGSGAG